MRPKGPILESNTYEDQIKSILYNYDQIVLDMRNNPDTQRILSIELQNPYHYEYFDNYIKNLFMRFDIHTVWMKHNPESPYRMLIYVYPK
jgi:hypothetical protein